jgi:hypothetical protein
MAFPILATSLLHLHDGTSIQLVWKLELQYAPSGTFRAVLGQPPVKNEASILVSSLFSNTSNNQLDTYECFE